MAILAGNDTYDRKLIIKRILTKLQELLQGLDSALKERLINLEILGGLRSEEVQQLIIKEEQEMPIIYDIRNDLRYKEGVSQGIAQGIFQGESRALTTIARNMIKKA